MQRKNIQKTRLITIRGSFVLLSYVKQIISMILADLRLFEGTMDSFSLVDVIGIHDMVSTGHLPTEI